MAAEKSLRATLLTERLVEIMMRDDVFGKVPLHPQQVHLFTALYMAPAVAAYDGKLKGSIKELDFAEGYFPTAVEGIRKASGELLHTRDSINKILRDAMDKMWPCTLELYNMLRGQDLSVEDIVCIIQALKEQGEERRVAVGTLASSVLFKCAEHIKLDDETTTVVIDDLLARCRGSPPASPTPLEKAYDHKLVINDDHVPPEFS